MKKYKCCFFKKINICIVAGYIYNTCYPTYYTGDISSMLC